MHLELLEALDQGGQHLKDDVELPLLHPLREALVAQAGKVRGRVDGVAEAGLGPVEPDVGLLPSRELPARRAGEKRGLAEKVLPLVEKPDVPAGSLDVAIEKLGL